jgi:23S rRNA pseudouridine1911/1915/1917 synthase
VTLHIQVDEQRAGRRLDVVVAEGAGVSRSRAGELVSLGAVSVHGRVERKSYRVAAGDVIDVAEVEAQAFEPPPGVRIAYEDDDVLVVDKPTGVVVHSAPGLREGTLVDALQAAGHALATKPGPDRPGVLHRLDRDVSGVLLVAKSDAAYDALAGAMARREIERMYTALVVGIPSVDKGKIDAPIGRNPHHPTRMTVLPDGRPSITWFRVVERFKGASLLEVTLETGRTHQIRVHLESIGHPVVGDAAYGRDPSVARRLGLTRIFLHARKLAFEHPKSGTRVEVESPLPPELEAALERLRDAE